MPPRGAPAPDHPHDVYRWGASVSFCPVVFFLASIPVAFVSTRAAVVVWFLSLPTMIVLFDRRKPPRADQLLG